MPWRESVDVRLVARFGQRRCELRAGASLAFGRTADLCVGSSPEMPRVLGVLYARESGWHVRNTSENTPIELQAGDDPRSLIVAPGDEVVLPDGDVGLEFSAGTEHGALRLTVANPQRRGLHAQPDPTDVTPFPGVILPPAMTVDQKRLVVALAEATLLGPVGGDVQLPTNRQAASRLEWTITRFNRKLDNVCLKLTKQGVPGLHGSLGDLALDRRRRLVEYALVSGLVRLSDLALLSAPDSDPDRSDTDPTAEACAANARIAS